MKGIDVSDWQGSIDFAKVKAAGYGFVIPREGYRCKTDGRFFEYVQKIQSAGLDIPGVYHFIYASNMDDAKAEAESCMANVAKAGLPKSSILWADWEYDSVEKAAASGINLSAAEQRSITETFCQTVQDAGYQTGIYLNADYLLNVFGKDIAERWDIWLADWNGEADYPCLYQQTSGTATVSGVSGKCDTDKYIGTHTVKEKTMGKCTAAQAVKAMEYYVGYCEKASSSYAQTRDKSAFTKNKGSNNYTYFGYFTGAQAQPWCAATVTTAIYDACGSKDSAKSVMWGVYPYLACNQIWDVCDSKHKYWSYYQRWTLGKGDRTNYIPVAGDIIIFTGNGTSRDHTGMVYACDGTYVYTIEGNSANMCRKRSYNLKDSYIYGWIRPNYAKSSDVPDTPVEQYGEELDSKLHVLSKGCAGSEVKAMQKLLVGYGFGSSSEIGSGSFGTKTEEALMKFQGQFWTNPDGICGSETWDKLHHYEG